MKNMTYTPSEEEKIADAALEGIPEKEWDQLVGNEEAMVQFVSTLQENMDFPTMGKVAKNMINILADYISEEYLIENLNHGVDLLVANCQAEEARVKAEQAEKAASA